MSIKFTNLKISKAKTIRPVGYKFPTGLNTGIPDDIDAENVPFSTGGTVTYTSTKVVHTFTSSGEFRTFFTTNNENGDLYQYADTTTGLTADILLIGGGGSGGSGSPGGDPGHYHGGGGGAGGLIYTSGLTIAKASPYTIIIGAGGSPHNPGAPSSFGNNAVGFPTHPEAGADSPPAPAPVGKAPSAPGEAGSIIALGGGRGGNFVQAGSPGGSGGGGGRPSAAGGSATSGQGNDGHPDSGPGGGAAPPGTTAPGPIQNPQCNGLEYSISGSPVYYAGGGGGAPIGGPSSGIYGGKGGGGYGWNVHTHPGSPFPFLVRSGDENRGSGGGGAGNNVGGGQGGKGIAIIAIDRVTQINGFDIN